MNKFWFAVQCFAESDTSQSNANYRPAFMGYFEQQDRSKQAAAGPQQPPQAIPVAPPQVPPSFPQQPAAPPAANRASAAAPPPATPANQFQGGGNAGRQPFQRSFIDGDFSFVSLKIICVYSFIFAFVNRLSMLT
jgi:hypothetical protein